MAKNAMKLNERDNVAMAMEDLAKGTIAEVVSHDGGIARVALLEDIPFGFKLATRDIRKGAEILKYGEVIGVASQDIKSGALVHVHNVDGVRARGDMAHDEGTR